MNPRAVIAEDEAALARALRDGLAQAWPALEVAEIATDGGQALGSIARIRPDVVFLDVRMPVHDGIEVARRLASSPHCPLIVFVTAYDQYALDAFDASAVDYLLKPVRAERLAHCVERLRARLESDTAPGRDLAALQSLLARFTAGVAGTAGPAQTLRFVRASLGETIRQIPIAEVLYFEARDKYVAVMTAEGESLIRVALSELETQLDPARFARIHRSRIVNLDEIEAIHRNLAARSVLHLRTRVHGREVRLEVSRAYAGNFRAM